MSVLFSYKVPTVSFETDSYADKQRIQFLSRPVEQALVSGSTESVSKHREQFSESNVLQTVTLTLSIHEDQMPTYLEVGNTVELEPSSCSVSVLELNYKSIAFQITLNSRKV